VLKGRRFRAQQHYQHAGGNAAADAKYLTLRKGDVVTVLETREEHNGWWRGAVGDRVCVSPFFGGF
jgi:hypothetical protein